MTELNAAFVGESVIFSYFKYPVVPICGSHIGGRKINLRGLESKHVCAGCSRVLCPDLTSHPLTFVQETTRTTS